MVGKDKSGDFVIRSKAAVASEEFAMTRRRQRPNTATKLLGFLKASVAKPGTPEAKLLSAKQIKQIRDIARGSQGLFAALPNVNSSTVQKWEQGKVKPQNAALRLLNIIDAKGIDVLK